MTRFSSAKHENCLRHRYHHRWQIDKYSLKSQQNDTIQTKSSRFVFSHLFSGFGSFCKCNRSLLFSSLFSAHLLLKAMLKMLMRASRTASPISSHSGLYLVNNGRKFSPVTPFGITRNFPIPSLPLNSRISAQSINAPRPPCSDKMVHFVSHPPATVPRRHCTT